MVRVRISQVSGFGLRQSFQDDGNENAKGSEWGGGERAVRTQKYRSTPFPFAFPPPPPRPLPPPLLFPEKNIRTMNGASIRGRNSMQRSERDETGQHT